MSQSGRVEFDGVFLGDDQVHGSIAPWQLREVGVVGQRKALHGVAELLQCVEEPLGLRDAGHEVLVYPGRRGILDLRLFINNLHKYDIQSILCEGGSALNGALLDAQLVDKVMTFVAPKMVGGNDPKTPVTGWGVQFMTQAIVLEEQEVRLFGDDVCIEGYVPGPHRRIAVPMGEAVS